MDSREIEIKKGWERSAEQVKKAERTREAGEVKEQAGVKEQTGVKEQAGENKTDLRPWEMFPDFAAGTRWGPLLLSLAVMALLTLAVYLFHVPNPNIILITGLAACTSLYGYGAGLVCGAAMMAYSMYFFSTDHSFFVYTSLNAQKLASVLVSVALNVLFIGRLKKIQTDDRNKILQTNLILRDDNHSLEQASAVDELTGVRNRYAFRRDYLRYENQNVHVMMFDLDNFKRTNDTMGHAVGDYVLKHVGETLMNAFGVPYCYRYGGDEFLVVCPDMPEERFARKTEEVRERLHRLTMDGWNLPVRFSAGYVYGRAELSADLRLMLRHADHNLYKAKGRGKDCACGSHYSRAFAERLEQEGKSLWDGEDLA